MLVGRAGSIFFGGVGVRGDGFFEFGAEGGVQWEVIRRDGGFRVGRDVGDAVFPAGRNKTVVQGVIMRAGDGVCGSGGRFTVGDQFFGRLGENVLAICSWKVVQYLMKRLRLSATASLCAESRD